MLQRIYSSRFKNNNNQRNILWKILVNNYLQQFISSKDDVLDLACGYGEFINNITCSKKYALDINPSIKKYLSKNIYFIKGDSTKIPLKDNSLDKVFISNFFEHITRNEITKTIKELKRVLRPNGKVLVLQPNIRYCAKDYWMFFDHITPIDDRALSEIFAVFDFTLEKKVERFLPFTTLSKTANFPFLLRIYLNFSILWRIFGVQSFLIFRLKNK